MAVAAASRRRSRDLGAAHTSVNFRRPTLNFQHPARSRTTAISLCVASAGPALPRSRSDLARAIFWARAPADALGVKQERERRWRKTASRQNNRSRERHGDNMTGTAQRETPQVAIFWLVQATEGEARLLAAGCPLDQAEPYGDCLTYGPGHYETWAHWRRDRTVEPALSALVRSYEYEDWPRGRIVFDRARDLFILYADRKLLTPATIARIATQFHLPHARTEILSDFHYQSTETPNGLGK
jgi:hypothetical protein